MSTPIASRSAPAPFDANRARLAACLCGSALLFCLVATLNTAGYRYGASDQAFYVPAVLQHLNPALFPRDRALLSAQDRLMVFDEIAAGMARLTGIPVPALFFGGYIFSLVLLWSGITLLGRTMYASWWSVAALTAVLTLRHRITLTGANTLEGYLHPRMLAFAVGVLALVLFLRGRPWWSVGLTLLSGALHPTTALWFMLWLAFGIAVEQPRARGMVVAGAAVAAAAALWAVTIGPLQGRLAAMDETWLAAFASKDYVFPVDWPASAWLTNLAYPVVLMAGLFLRTRWGITRPRERGLVIGCVALAVVFLASLPLIAMRLALAVQLQFSRVFWMLDFLTAVYVIALLMESPGRSLRARQLTCAVVSALAVSRGVYVTDHAGRSLVQTQLTADPWHDAMRWIRTTPAETHLLADPGHAWRYGSSVRLSGERDVYLEEVKDAALAIYSREVAVRVVTRTGELGDFGALTTEHADALARRYRLDYLIAERPFELPIVYRNTQFTIYRLRP